MISIEEFRNLYFTYFKGEEKAHQIYNMLLPYLTVWSYGDQVFSCESEIADENVRTAAEKFVSV